MQTTTQYYLYNYSMFMTLMFDSIVIAHEKSNKVSNPWAAKRNVTTIFMFDMNIQYSVRSNLQDAKLNLSAKLMFDSHNMKRPVHCVEQSTGYTNSNSCMFNSSPAATPLTLESEGTGTRNGCRSETFNRTRKHR